MEKYRTDCDFYQYDFLDDYIWLWSFELLGFVALDVKIYFYEKFFMKNERLPSVKTMRK